MARMLLDQEHEDLADRMELYTKQVAAGVIPRDSPGDFVLPEGQDALVNGLPWWFGPDYSADADSLNVNSPVSGSQGGFDLS